MPSVPPEAIRWVVHVGLMLFLGLVAGELATRMRLPKVTGYLLAGLALGPSLSGAVQNEELRRFDLVAQIALGLILFNIGGDFEAGHVRAFAKKLLTVTAFKMGACWLVVGVAVWSITRDATLALVTGFIAMETGPATTLMVVREYESEGPLTSNLIALVGINNLLCLVLFPFLLVALVGESSGGIGVAFAQIGKSLILGAGLGLLVSFLEERAYAPKQEILLGFFAIMLAIGLSYAWGGSGPLSALVMGMTKVNSSPRGATLFERLDASAYPLYVLFFMIAGANLHLDTLFTVGSVGMAYIVGRGVAKLGGAALGTRVAGFSDELQKYLGPAMFSHAGVAVGLAIAVGQVGGQTASVAQAVVLGSIVFYEIVGPIMVRFSLVRCGEVKIASLLPHLPGQSSVDNLERIVTQLRRSLGLPVRGLKKYAGPPTAKHVMRTNVETIPHTARYDELLSIFAHARYQVLPVVDTEGSYVGNISFPRIRDMIFDQTLADLVIAGDLLDAEKAYVGPDDPLGDVLQKFQNIQYEIGDLPVVLEGERPRVIGMIRQRDVVDVFRRIRSDASGERSR
ncbi:MAG: cation:proton antiporter [Candidatus Abyssubacteria bacterium]